jgi:hypothetical protein
MPGELWAARRIAEEFGFSSPGSARKWLSKLNADGKGIPIADVTVDHGRYIHLYDSTVVLARRRG